MTFFQVRICHNLHGLPHLFSATSRTKRTTSILIAKALDFEGGLRASLYNIICLHSAKLAWGAYSFQSVNVANATTPAFQSPLLTLEIDIIRFLLAIHRGSLIEISS